MLVTELCVCVFVTIKIHLYQKANILFFCLIIQYSILDRGSAKDFYFLFSSALTRLVILGDHLSSIKLDEKLPLRFQQQTFTELTLR